MCAGSRLPAPLAWPLLEVWHSAIGTPAADSVAATLLWLVSLEAAGSTYLSLIPIGNMLADPPKTVDSKTVDSKTVDSKTVDSKTVDSKTVEYFLQSPLLAACHALLRSMVTPFV